MIQLRESTKRKITDLLNKSHFTASAFSVTYEEESQDFLIISFIPNKVFKFTAEKTYSNFSTTEAPGLHIVTEETFKREALDDCLKAISPWISRILEDYRTHNPLVDEFETLRKTISEQIEQHIGDEAAHFSGEEMESIRTKLDDLSAKLAEVTEKTFEQEKQLRDAQAEIKNLKADLEVFPKGVWYRMAGSKVLNILKKAATSKEGREFALEAAKKFLIEGPK